MSFLLFFLFYFLKYQNFYLFFKLPNIPLMYTEAVSRVAAVSASVREMFSFDLFFSQLIPSN